MGSGPVTLDTLDTLDAAAFVALLGNVYEHASWAAETAFAARPFRRVDALHAALREAISAAPEERRLALLHGHPDLAGKAARAGALSPELTGEQGEARLDRLSDEDFAKFQRLNQSYRQRFGFPFILCVRRHGKDSILAQFERRLGNEPAAERAAAFAEIDRIAALRLSALVTGAGALPVNGRLSTHILDTRDGRPAAGVGIELRALSNDGGGTLIARAVSKADGRTDRPLIAERPVPVGRYELSFAIGAYFAARGGAGAQPPFLDTVPIRFAVAEPEGNYHVPLLVTPWGYTTYRGS